MRNPIIVFAAGVFLCVVLIGCSGNPAVPQDPETQQEIRASVGTGTSGHYCGGYSILTIDTENFEIDVRPCREANLHLNVTRTLNNTMGVAVQGIPAEHDPANGIFVFDISLTHPFADKPNLTGFDVKGILIAPGVFEFNELDVPVTWLINNDGFTRWWNPVEFTEGGLFGYTPGIYANRPPEILTGQVNPYKYFADVLEAETDVYQLNSVDIDMEGGRGMFSSGASNTRRYRIRFPLDPTPRIEYGYAVDASWEAPSVKPPENLPDDFPIEANQPEAYIAELSIVANSLFYDSETGNSGGVLRLETTLCDWQGLVNADIAAEVGSMTAYIPAYYDDGVAFNPGANSWTSASFSLDLTGDLYPMYALEFYVAAEAESAGGETYDQGLGYPAPATVIAAWDVIEVPVVDPPCETDSNNDFAEAEEIGLNDQVTGYLCAGTDNEDYYTFYIPHDMKCTGERIYANVNLDESWLILWDENLYPVASANYGQDLEIDLTALALQSGTYYISIETDATNGEASAYFIETDMDFDYLGELVPVDVTTGDLDLHATWAKMWDHYLYLAGPSGIWVYFYFDPENPVLVYRSYEPVSGDPAFYFPYMYFLYIDDYSYLHMIDFTDPINPINHGRIATMGSPVDFITMSDMDLYMYEKETDRVHIWNYSNNPTLIEPAGDFDAFNGATSMGCIAPANTYTSIALMSNDVFALYLVEDPYNVEQTGFEYLDSAANQDFDIHGDSIVKIHQTMMGDYFRTYHLASGDFHLVYDGQVSLPEAPRYVVGHYPNSYVASDETGNTMSVSVIDPTNPAVVNTKITGVDCAAIEALSNDLVSVSKNMGMSLFDVLTDGTPLFVSTTTACNHPVTGIVENNIGFFANENADFTNLTTVDLTDPEAPTIVHQYPYDYKINEIVACSDGTDGLYVLVGENWFIDAYRNYSTGYLDYIQTRAFLDDPLCATTHFGRMYIGFATGNEMKVYDVSAPNSFNEIGSATVQTPISDLVENGDTLYGISNSLVTVYDISDLHAPVELTGYDASGYTLNSLEVRDEYLLVNTTTGCLVLDISDPHSPTLAGELTLPTPPEIQSMQLYGYDMFSCNGELHPFVSDITDPAAPSGSDMPFAPPQFMPINDILVFDGYLIEMTDGAGLRIWDLYQ